ncbi:uncharacterized protein MELLADRAFT_106426 [Melampsora larici-populina 98AG31]|uniref:BZIP domain-containing protein n=1 Tax=Melampsora larici-populina (strain 98AG31 / pathotype 3-4-7) TaxID=747676 RepID=F4RLC7_MELLP|nr:uncharacterized protein MELLADRAFT_106426 [Melampsora larici-populina 98AG31]EGG06893.1 hypothetical protein MELLADRAFT_106426 [Melampsora larici-populina 98AG31]
MTVRSGGLPLSNTRTSLPQIKSKFDLEPNPFEQSFKGNSSTDTNSSSNHHLNLNSPSFNHLLNNSSSSTQANHHQLNRHRRARSSSPHHSSSNRDCHLSPPLFRNTPGGSLVKVSLPGIASIASPAILNNLPSDQSRKSTSPPSVSASSSSHQSNPPITAISSFGWGFSSLGQDSLRTGPLSPALLNGPARNSLPTHTALNSLIGLGTPTNDAFTPGTSALLAIFSSSTSDAPLSNTITSDNSHTSPAAISSSLPSHSQPTTISTSLNLTSQPLQPSKSSIVEDLSLTRPSSSLTSLQPPHSSPPAISPSLSLSTSLQSSDRNSVLPTSRRSQSILPNPLITSNDHLSKAVTPILPQLGLITTSGTTPLLNSNTNETLNEFDGPLQNMKRASVSPALASTRLPLQPTNHPHHPSVPHRPSTSKSPVMPQPAHVPPLVYPPYLATSVGIFAPSTNNTQPTPTSASSIPPNSISTLESPLSAQANHNYSNNPLYLLTAAHDRIAHHQQQEQLMDDATVTAANALTGLVNSRSGSRYSSPGPASSSSTHPHPAYLNTSPQSTQHSLYPLSHSLSHLQPQSKNGMPTSSVPGPSVPYQMMPSNGTSNMMIKGGTLYSSSSSSTAMKPSTETSPSTLNPKNNRRTNVAPPSSKKNGKRKKEEEEETNQPDKASQKARKDTLESYTNYDEPMNGNGNDSDSDGNDWGAEDGAMNDRGSASGKGGGGGGGGGGGKGETEEEKRKNFLERNRQAALKCRQRKKAWLANLQSKVESLERENEGLEMTIGRLREEIESIRSILLVHHDECVIRVGNGNGREMNIGELIRGGIGQVLRGGGGVHQTGTVNQQNQTLTIHHAQASQQGAGQGYGY